MSVTSRTFDRIREMIATGELQPGERLAPEQELANYLGVSRGSLREAVKALAAINVLDVRRGDGTFVTKLEPAELLTGLVFAMELLQVRGLSEVLEIRRLVVPAATALACERISDEQLGSLRGIIDELEQAAEPDRVAELHQKFKEIVFDAVDNETLGALVHSLQLKGETFRARAWLDSGAVAQHAALAEQRALLEAFEHRDSELARSLMTVQLDSRKTWVERSVDSVDR